MGDALRCWRALLVERAGMTYIPRVRIVYPAPVPDLASRMADALCELADDELSNARTRLDAYATWLSTRDILSLRGVTFRKYDAAARKAASGARA